MYLGVEGVPLQLRLAHHTPRLCEVLAASEGAPEGGRWGEGGAWTCRPGSGHASPDARGAGMGNQPAALQLPVQSQLLASPCCPRSISAELLEHSTPRQPLLPCPAASPPTRRPSSSSCPRFFCSDPVQLVSWQALLPPGLAAPPPPPRRRLTAPPPPTAASRESAATARRQGSRAEGWLKPGVSTTSPPLPAGALVWGSCVDSSRRMEQAGGEAGRPRL